MDSCIVCELPRQQSANAGARDVVRYRCDRCGQFDITGSAIAFIPNVRPADRPMISDWILEHNALGETPLIRSEDFVMIVGRRRIGWREKADRLLLALLRATDAPGAVLDVREPRFSGTLQTYDTSTVMFLGKLLQSEGWVEATPGNPQTVSIAPRGFIHTDELKLKAASSAQAFVAMWFSEEMKPLWINGFEPGVRAAGYDPLRIDMKEHAGKICDEIIAEIRRSHFVVADFTGQRHGVYFEAGFAAGLGLHVIWTCRRDDIKNLHFDIRQYNCIDWVGSDDLTERLRNRIEAVIGEGPRLRAR
jgi:nucleoside 2-deoxyribosyltransferase